MSATRAAKPTNTEPDPSTAQLSVIFAEHAPMVFRVLRRWGASEQDAEDLCQEVFLVAQRRLSDFQGRSAVRTWLLAIARRVLSNHRRLAAHRHEQSDGTTPEPAVEADQPRSLQLKADLLRLDRILAAMRDEDREVFVLYEIEQLTIAEIAAVTETASSTIHSRLQIARKTIRAAMANPLQEDTHEV